MMRFPRSSLDRQTRQDPDSARHGRPAGLPRWAVTAGLAAVVVASLIGVAMASVLRSAQAPDGASGRGVIGSAVNPVPQRTGGAGPGYSPATRPAGAGAAGPAAAGAAGPAKAARTPAPRAGAAAARASAARARAARARHGAGRRPAALRTSCRSVAHIGDSTSVDLISPAYLPDPAQRLAARYHRVGVKNLRVDASGGRSIVEEMPGQVNGYGVASTWRKDGYRGCWVLALGTNDAANVSSGSAVGLMARIQAMMSVAHGQPVMWVNTRTLAAGGPWSQAGEQAWDRTLVRALARYPNMRIFNWAAVAQPGWFLPDGIHYNSYGCARRASAIANALARAFPLHGSSTGRIVR
jgi:hypothetical protein